ncbi:MAG TPA: hypothetical protein VG245_09535 [Candidatus Dormibacteraeota bacterium]|nr:hypothetical protein [Candidatus Dormibacteraeota bacterium]
MHQRQHHLRRDPAPAGAGRGAAGDRDQPQPGRRLSLQERPSAEIAAEVADLESRAAPLRRQLEALQAQAEALRTELRRRERLETLRGRQEVRTDLGERPSLEDVLTGAEPVLSPGLAFDALHCFRESATEVRLGYAAAARQSIDMTDGAAIRSVTEVDEARRLWREGWEPGTPAARGVRIHPVGSRAERLVPAAEVRVQAPLALGDGPGLKSN